MYLCILFLFLFSTTLSFEMDDILKDLSWAARLKLLKEIPIEVLDPNRTTKSPLPIEDEKKPEIFQDAERFRAREVGMELLQLRQGIENMTAVHPREVPEIHEQNNDDENSMRLKLFRLMYETVRDNDLKTKRADLIKEYYKNMKSFEIGVLMGDIQEKFNTIVDTQETLKKFYHIWKPIEHVNAYEQIINLAMEISQLIDLVRLQNREKSVEPMYQVSTISTSSHTPFSSVSDTYSSSGSDGTVPTTVNKNGPEQRAFSYSADYGGLPHGKW